MDPVRPIGPRTELEGVERIPLLAPAYREERRREREERRRKQARQGRPGPPEPRSEDAPAPREWRA